MQKLFSDTRKLDSSCRFAYGLSEEIMMENAASALENEIRKAASSGDKVIILCGGGNNGADGYALARRIRLDFEVNVYQCYEPSSKLCVLQSERAEKCGLSFRNIENLPVGDLRTAAVIIDCIFGSGFHGDFEGAEGENIICALNDINCISCKKIACDVPSGLRCDGTVAQVAFMADLTVTMGAQKSCLYSDMAKDYTGSVVVANLGVNRSLYENSSNENFQSGWLLDQSDLVLPLRRQNFVNKGSFGTAYIACGEKSGAAIIASQACFRFGAGLVTLIRPEKDFGKTPLPGFTMDILTATEFGSKINSLAAGMGLGYDEKAAKFYIDYLLKNPQVSCVLDADVLYSPLIKTLLEKRGEGCVLTPHPKEMAALLKICGIGDYSIEECICRRSQLVEEFCRAYKNVVLVAKGANPVIGCCTEKEGFKLYVNVCGTPALAKGGSGDVLSGLICALLAQKYEPAEAAVNASLAHAIASRKIKNAYALTPQDLIDAVAQL